MQGGKLSVLAAAVDPRVVALCLLDPVDNTVWAPWALATPLEYKPSKSLETSRYPKSDPESAWLAV